MELPAKEQDMFITEIRRCNFLVHLECRGMAELKGNYGPNHEGLLIFKPPELWKNSGQEVMSLALHLRKIVLAAPESWD